ncbi:jg7939 [Pararge aegeria aegeria]|uniref:Jg7939 protein n=1 Tax=Pararge aegeria aegeria TaxID=348720 RepID=A0A8S4SH67_9NEOP|nr:jg7939 [Pararge aegeria aegeria]
MYCKSGQSTEEEMYNNQEAGPAFVEFLQMLGQTVRLKDFDKYKAGLDNRTDSTGLYSVYTTYQGCEIMFHVSTMLPYTPNNRQQLLRKRHIGNDIVTIVFQEPGAAPFTPRNIRSQFQHVFVVVRVIDPCTENTHYSLAVSRAKEVPLFGPPIKDGAVYPKGEAFTDLLLSKVINGENAAIQSPKFSTMATRTRQEYLKDLASNYVSASTVDTGQKFSIFSSLLMKSGNNSNNNAIIPRIEDCNNDVLVRGFHVQADGLVTAVENGGAASKAGVKRGARLLEVCRAAVIALPHDHLVDLLKTSDPVTVRLTFAVGARCECQSACGEAWAQQPSRRRLSPPRSDTSGYGTGGSGRSTTSGGGNGGSLEVRRRNHDGSSPRHSRRPRSAAHSSLTEELMRLMDAELGENRAATVSEGNGVPREVGGAPLPLPDASALDWAALVHTATRAMLQICEEHQYQSIDPADPPLDSATDVGLDTWTEMPNNNATESKSSPVVNTDRGGVSGGGLANCGCGLAERVATLEADAVTAQRHRHHLEEEVRRLRRLNGRLREESARAVWQLRHFTQWFKRTVDKQ